ncbi:MAG TPA: EAL domain-containing protein [Mycobacteriales bacterium]|nr:EAL domain-containing protein [Mycobacteriales bacterium]
MRGPLKVGGRPTADRYRWLVESVQEVIFEADPEGRWTYLNPAWHRILGYDVDQCLGTPFLDYVHPEDRQANLDIFVDTLTTGKEKCRFEARYVTADGGVRWMEIHAWIFRDAAGASLGSTGTITDVTERHLAKLELERRATHDSLTGLPNRALLDQELVAAIHRCAAGERPLALVFLDLDRFKLVNDSLGHDAGDEVLRAVAGRLQQAAQSGEVIGRFGGDEFVLISDMLSPAAMRSFTHRLHSTVSAPISVAGRELGLSASVGASMLAATAAAQAVSDGTVAELAATLLRDADSAMYHAKETGRDRTEIFSADTRARIVNKFDTETELRLAIIRGELLLMYQPQIDLGTGAVVGFEALVRWDHPQRGRLLPADFMEVAEDSGLVVPLGRWVLAEACRASVVLERTRNQSARMAVNVSAREMLSSGLVADLADILAETGASPDRLCLELTESALLPDADAAAAIMTELADLGLQLSLDDFGTGFSSLTYLQRLPLRELKIDRSFVSQIQQKDGLAMVAAVMSLAEALGLETVAEGVEDPYQVRALTKLGCTTGQGFLLGHPAELADAVTARPVLPSQRRALSRV